MSLHDFPLLWKQAEEVNYLEKTWEISFTKTETLTVLRGGALLVPGLE